MKVDIQVERAAEALDQRHRAALRCAPPDARLIRQPARDHAMHDAQHRADGFGLAGERSGQPSRRTGDSHQFGYPSLPVAIFCIPTNFSRTNSICGALLCAPPSARCALRTALVNPPKTARKLLDDLLKAGLPETVSLLETMAELL